MIAPSTLVLCKFIFISISTQALSPKIGKLYRIGNVAGNSNFSPFAGALDFSLGLPDRARLTETAESVRRRWHQRRSASARNIHLSGYVNRGVQNAQQTDQFIWYASVFLGNHRMSPMKGEVNSCSQQVRSSSNNRKGAAARQVWLLCLTLPSALQQNVCLVARISGHDRNSQRRRSPLLRLKAKQASFRACHWDCYNSYTISGGDSDAIRFYAKFCLWLEISTSQPAEAVDPGRCR